MGVPQHAEDASPGERADVTALQCGEFETRLQVPALGNVVVARRDEVAAGAGAVSLDAIAIQGCLVELEPAVDPRTELLAYGEYSPHTDQRRFVVVFEVPRRRAVDGPEESGVVQRFILVQLGL